ncbi:hypothetical protein K493DRAFT_314248 [Basidiobolus meristosporus CBS 931.73]|uniref:Yeast cell wall synthesis Kre9/Knh1-like N-terminal domain-containing protein n=1 Tax=Basidiobolus meristosporus CBS 931.73 TaxID=1314790 RepID=A0A1Y1YGC6_9FUNG|nr:hypothetical protein K493DRAFT_314248 [Basidiobolus meristosporus CBS 931.73]|eukprot:ORX97035.1 hypothetical protein K493DRAFT_314248 [Basidiobolus meristosporus CBS 931.73]
MKASLFLLSTVLSAIGIIDAAIYPVNPTGETVWKVGTSVQIEWKDNDAPPSLATLKPFTVDLYTGLDMTQLKLANIATNITSKTTSLQYTVPDVAPYGKLYFLRFTAPNPKDSQSPYYYWTTRFTITDGDSTVPSPSTAGTGSLVSPTASSDPVSQSSTMTTESGSKSLSTSTHFSSSSANTIETPSSSTVSTEKPAASSTSSMESSTTVSSTWSTDLHTLSSVSSTTADAATSSVTVQPSVTGQPSATNQPESSATVSPSSTPTATPNGGTSIVFVASTWSVVLGVISYFLI